MFALFFWQMILIQDYQTNVRNVLDKITLMFESKVDILRPAEKFFQQAMQELIPPSQRTPLPTPSVIHINTNSQNPLPAFFSEF